MCGVEWLGVPHKMWFTNKLLVGNLICRDQNILNYIMLRNMKLEIHIVNENKTKKKNHKKYDYIPKIFF